MLPRRDRRGGGARLRQGDRQDHAGHRAQRRRPAARLDGDLQRLVRSHTGDGHGRHRADEFEQAPALDRLDSHGAGAGQSGARLRQVGRPAGGRRSVSFLDHARLSHRHERSRRAGLSLLRRDRSGGRDRKGNTAARPEALSPGGAAASGLRRDQRSRAATSVGAKPGDPRRLRRAQQRGGDEPGRARRSVCRFRWSISARA